MDKKPVCVIGSLNIDLIIHHVPRLITWGTEVFGGSHVAVSAGQGGYTAFALSRLGLPTMIIGNVGKDSSGKQILKDLRSYKVDIKGVEISSSEQTGITVAIVREDGERGFVSSYASLVDLNEEMILRHWSQVDAAGIICLVGLFNTPNLSIEAAARVLTKAKQVGKITMLDTGWDPGDWSNETINKIKNLLSTVTLFMPNIDEAKIISAKSSVEEAALTLQSFGPEMVVIKCGADGSYARVGKETYFKPTYPVKVFDAVGAGDTFNAGFIYGLGSKWSIENCLAFGNATAALYISRDRDRWPTVAEVNKIAGSYGVIFD